MNNKEFEDLFYKVLKGVDYADILEDVDLEDVPEENHSKVGSLLDIDIIFTLSSLSIVDHLGIREGFAVLTDVQSRAIRVDDFASSVWL